MAVLVGCVGCSSADAPAEDDTGPVTVTLKVSSYTRTVTVSWSMLGTTAVPPAPREVTPPWSEEREVERGTRVALVASVSIAACEILVDGKSVVKAHSRLSGEGAECVHSVE